MTEIVRYRGDTWSIRMIILKDDQPLDITGCTFLLTVDPAKNPVDASNNLMQLIGSIEGNPIDGVVEFPVSEAAADHLGKFYYDLQMIDTSAKKRTIVKNRFSLIQDITKT